MSEIKSEIRFCAICGTAFPLACVAMKAIQCTNPKCKQWTYRNQRPVAVVLQPVDNIGLLCEVRAIPPIGEVSLISGYIDEGEFFEEGCEREASEETNKLLHIDKEKIKLIAVRSTRKVILIFGIVPPITEAEANRIIQNFRPNEEVSSLVIVRSVEHKGLAFPFHTEMAKMFFDHAAGKTHCIWCKTCPEHSGLAVRI